MIVPLFVPSRWRRPVPAADPEMSEASEFVADLMEKQEPPRAASGLRPTKPEPPRAYGSVPDV